jgi:hypothetical protein
MASFFSDSFKDDGLTKPDFLDIVRSPTRGFYWLGAKFSNPVVLSCSSAGVCDVSFLLTLANGGQDGPIVTFKYEPSIGDWVVYGNQQEDLQDGFNSFAQLSNSNGVFWVGLDFGIQKRDNPDYYNSAKAEFKDKNGNVDTTHYFLQKPSTCPTNSRTYYGLPYANTQNPTSQTPDADCNSWFNFNSETLLKTMNTKILQGGYKVVVTAYTSNNWTGASIVKEVPVKTPFLTSDKVNASMFPVVRPKVDSSGPYLDIPNASDFILTGSVCLSSIGGCDMTNLPNYTSHYQHNFNVPLLSKYRPIAADGWPVGVNIRSYFVHAQDKYGRDLRVND